MSRDERRPTPVPAAERDRLLDRIRRLVLMRETGPKSAAWHRARVSAIWRLQRDLDFDAKGAPSGSRRKEQSE